MDSNYYREYYDLERQHWWFKAREEIIEAQIKKLASGKRLKILNNEEVFYNHYKLPAISIRHGANIRNDNGY